MLLKFFIIIFSASAICSAQTCDSARLVYNGGFGMMALEDQYYHEDPNGVVRTLSYVPFFNARLGYRWNQKTAIAFQLLSTVTNQTYIGFNGLDYVRESGLNHYWFTGLGLASVQ
jgi:hypothetical protein